jgi:hypothetical protein
LIAIDDETGDFAVSEARSTDDCACVGSVEDRIGGWRKAPSERLPGLAGRDRGRGVQALAGISHISAIMLISMFAPYVHSFFIQTNIPVAYNCKHARLSSPDYHGTSDDF